MQMISRILSEQDFLTRYGISAMTAGEQAHRRQLFWQRSGIITILIGTMVGCMIPIAMGLFPTYAGLENLMILLGGISGFIVLGGSALLIWSDSLSPAPPGTGSPRIDTRTESISMRKEDDNLLQRTLLPDAR